MKQFWAYRHVDGHIHVKNYNPSFPEEVTNAESNTNIVDYLPPYEASNRAQAEAIAVEELGVASHG